MTSLDPATADALRAAVAQLAAIQARIEAVSGRADGEWRRELIALRRQLQQQITTIAQLMATVEDQGEDMRRLRGALTLMRTRVALHQANWPAVAIDRDDPGYRQSVSGIRAANRDFIASMRAFLTPDKA